MFAAILTLSAQFHLLLTLNFLIMADETSKVTEKVYCYDHPSAYQNNNDLIGAIMSKNNDGTNAMWNNPFAYLIWMMLIRNWNNDGTTNGENFNSRQISALQDTVNTNHNNDLAMQAINGNANAISELASNFNASIQAVQMAVSGVKSAIETVGGNVAFSAERVINAANMGNMNIIQQLKDCCCTTQKSILTQGYETQLATERQTNTLQSANENTRQAVVNGFANIGYQNATNTANIINAINASQQKTSDLLTTHWQAETSQALQDAKFEISQLKQNQYLANVINGGCNCGNGQ